MKRTKLMLGVAALSAALLGTGYAAMTDVLTINGTVNTAKFDVNFTGAQVTEIGNTKINAPDEVNGVAASKGLKNVSAAIEGDDSVSISAENLRPGVPVSFKTTMQNDSTVNAIMEQLTVSAGENIGEKVLENVKVQIKLNDQVVIANSLAELVKDNIEVRPNVDLNPGASTDVYIQVGLQQVKGNTEQRIALTEELSEANADFQIKFDWAEKPVQ